MPVRQLSSGLPSALAVTVRRPTEPPPLWEMGAEISTISVGPSGVSKRTDRPRAAGFALSETFGLGPASEKRISAGMSAPPNRAAFEIVFAPGAAVKLPTAPTPLLMRHPDYAASQRIRRRLEEAFGWAKTIAGLAKVKLRGLPRVRFKFTLAMAAYNLIRMPRLLAET